MADAADIALRRQMAVERLKAGRYADAQKLRASIEAIIQDQFKPLLSKDSMAELGRGEFQAIITQVTKKLNGVLTDYKLDTLDWLEDLSGVEAHIAAGVFEQVSGKNAGELDLAKIWAEVSKAHTPANGLTVADTLQSGSDYTMGLIIRRLRMGWVDGQKPEDVLRAILGTDALQSKDGILNKLENAYRAGSNTNVQHVVSKTDIVVVQQASGTSGKYQWISVLDDVTTVICQHRNGLIYDNGKGPLPPAHWNCRSTTVQLDSGEPLDLPTNKEEWAKEQPPRVRQFITSPKLLTLADYAKQGLKVFLQGFRRR